MKILEKEDTAVISCESLKCRGTSTSTLRFHVYTACSGGEFSGFGCSLEEPASQDALLHSPCRTCVHWLLNRADHPAYLCYIKVFWDKRRKVTIFLCFRWSQAWSSIDWKRHRLVLNVYYDTNQHVHGHWKMAAYGPSISTKYPSPLYGYIHRFDFPNSTCCNSPPKYGRLSLAFRHWYGLIRSALGGLPKYHIRGLLQSVPHNSTP